MAPRGRQPRRLAAEQAVPVRPEVMEEEEQERCVIESEPQYTIDIERWRQQVEQEWTMAEEVEREDADMALEQHLSELGCNRAPSNVLANEFFGLDGSRRVAAAVKGDDGGASAMEDEPGSPLQRVRTIKRASRTRRMSAWEKTPSPKDLPLPHIAGGHHARDRRAPAWQDSPETPDLPPPEVIFGHRLERRLEDSYTGQYGHTRSPSAPDRRYLSSSRRVPEWQMSPETPALPSPEVLFANQEDGYRTSGPDSRHRRVGSAVDERGVKRLAPRAVGGPRTFGHARVESESAVLRRPNGVRPEVRSPPAVHSPAVSSLSPPLGDALLPPLEESLFSWEFPVVEDIESMDGERERGENTRVLRKRSSKGVKRPYQNAFSGDEGHAPDAPPRARKLARAPKRLPPQTPLAECHVPEQRLPQSAYAERTPRTSLEARSPRVLTKARPQASLAQEYAKGERRREEMRRELMENVLGMRC
ncbi:hypothetical protein EV121DRAFT_270579 [Schizophyllum commune]